jgi:hypothetical protein
MRTGQPRAVGTNVDMVPLGYAASSSSRVAAIDFDRDGRDEIVIASEKELVIIRYGGYRETFLVWRSKARGGATAIASGDLDGDGYRDLVVGWGATKSAPKAKARLTVYRSRGAVDGSLLEEVAVAPNTSRAQFTSIQVTRIEAGGPVGILYANFASKYDGRVAFASLRNVEEGANATWTDRQLYQRRMATKVSAGPVQPGKNDIAVFIGRTYGDEPKTDGDVFELGADGKRTLLPSTRGVRSLSVLALGSAADPRLRVCYGDGWHWRYKEKARGLLTCAEAGEDGKFTSEVIESTKGYEISDIAAADLDGDRVNELIARGPKALYRYIPVVAVDGVRTWDPRIIGPGGKQFSVVDIDGDGRDEIVIGGEKPALLVLR